ncbi:MAG: ABC transporter permease [Desulfovibrio sp.]|jgi:ABC-2 type transport system permease protein|nr:ABC transporter permease [Desulfovibrio sp.]
MSRERVFSLTRWWGVVVKEFLQLRRDRLTFGMIVGLPVVQLLLFGYAINSDPRNLPTALILGGQNQFTRSIEASLRNSEYFSFIGTMDEETARHALARGEVQFVVSVPVDFSRRLLRGEGPAILVEADATDPTATSGALGALQGIVQSVAQKELTGALAHLRKTSEAFSIQVHKMYNPEGLTRYNTVPGLMGVILTMSMVMTAGLAITKERERGTMENLLSSPVSPLEIMTGKIIPYILIGHIQAGIIIVLARLLFNVPFMGNPFALYLAVVLFIAANLTVGVALSSFAKNQLQAMQMTIFYVLPNIMLSGFMFPFAGMPPWAQAIGSILPLTHFNRSVRGILLKGNDWADLWPTLWPVVLFFVAVMALSVRFFRRTLD